MNICGHVVEIAHGVTIEKKDGGTYAGTRFTYRDTKGKVGEQNFHEKTLGFNNLQESLDSLSEKDPFTMIKEKGDAGFWNVKSLSKGIDEATGVVAGNQVRQGGGGKYNNDTYETNDMRRLRQTSITRLASIGRAIDFLVATKDKFKIQEVFDVALKIEEEVLREFPIIGVNFVEEDDVIQ